MRIAPAELLSTRTANARAGLAARAVDALVVTSLPNIAYLAGFFASAAAAIVTPADVVLIGDSRYADALSRRARECSFLRVLELPSGRSYDQALADALLPLSGLTVGFEASHLTVARYQYLTRRLEATRWSGSLVPCDGVIEGCRVRKDSWELGVMREGAGRLSEVAKYILSNVLAGRTESEVAAAIESRLRRTGFERVAFDTIVASGPNAALPHARAGGRRIEPGDLVVLDFGGVLDGYCTDLSRTVATGGGGRERRLIEQVVEAQEAAFAAVRGGAAPEAVDAAARASLAGHGMADAFTHGTGHGLGLEVHEAPRITRARPEGAEPALAAGMVLTLEPGAYFPGWGGVRIEDDVLVTDDGAEWLTDVPKAF